MKQTICLNYRSSFFLVISFLFFHFSFICSFFVGLCSVELCVGFECGCELQIVNLKCSSSTLAGQEVEVVPTKTLKVDLPSHRTITVVAHKGRTLGEVLKPLLNKYGYKLESCSVWNDGRAVSLDILAINAPARIVLSNSGSGKTFLNSFCTKYLVCKYLKISGLIFSEPPQETTKFHDESQRGQTTLDEITNKVFEELLVGKSTKSCNFSEGSCKVIFLVFYCFHSW